MKTHLGDFQLGKPQAINSPSRRCILWMTVELRRHALHAHSCTPRNAAWEHPQERRYSLPPVTHYFTRSWCRWLIVKMILGWTSPWEETARCRAACKNTEHMQAETGGVGRLVVAYAHESSCACRSEPSTLARRHRWCHRRSWTGRPCYRCIATSSGPYPPTCISNLTSTVQTYYWILDTRGKVRKGRWQNYLQANTNSRFQQLDLVLVGPRRWAAPARSGRPSWQGESAPRSGPSIQGFLMIDWKNNTQSRRDHGITAGLQSMWFRWE
jgi:hypothetical protein